MLSPQCYINMAICLVTFGGWSSLFAVAHYNPSPADIARKIDASLVREMNLTRDVEVAADAVFMRRISLDLVGRIPTPREVIQFDLDTDQDKRSKLVDRLLEDPAYGENWARYWRDVILYRRTDEKALISNRSLVDYLQQAFNKISRGTKSHRPSSLRLGMCAMTVPPA